MLRRLGATDLVPAGPYVRPQRSYESLPPPAGGQASFTGSDGDKPLPGAQRQQAAECVDAEWTEVVEEAQPASIASPARAHKIAEAYRATDPIQPRPGLFLRVTA